MIATYVLPWACRTTSSQNDALRARENTAVAIDVLRNDVGTSLRLQKVAGGAAQIGDVIASIRTSYGVIALTLGSQRELLFDPGSLFNSLRLGQTTSFLATYEVQDARGQLAEAQVTITVEGLNDRPTFHIMGPRLPIFEALNASGQNIAPIYGRLVVSDTDAGDLLVPHIVGSPTLTYSGGAIPESNHLAALKSQHALTFSNGLSNGGTLTLSWMYDPTSANLDFLRQGETVQIRYALAVSDGHSQTATRNLVLYIKGTNDAPIIKSTDPAFDVKGTLIETNAALSTAGRVVFADVDRADTPAATVITSDATVSATGIVLSEAQVAAFKTGLTITNASTGIWTYNLPAESTQFLGVGDEVKINYTVLVTDDFGASKKQRLTLTIDGTNDIPRVQPGPITLGILAEARDASAQDLPPSWGALIISDLDVGDTLSAHIVGAPVLRYFGGPLPVNVIPNVLVSPSALIFGDDKVSNGGQRSISWHYDPPAANLDFLSPGEYLHVRYSARVSDGHSFTRTLFLSRLIGGTNDVPTVSAAAATPFTEEANAHAQDLSQIGTVNFNDLDANDVIDIRTSYNDDVAWSNGTLTSATIAALTSGTFTANATDAAAPGTTLWTFAANDVDLDFLDTGENITFSFTITATDKYGASSTDTVNIVINGTAETGNASPSADLGFIQQTNEAPSLDLSASSMLSYHLLTSTW